MFGSKVQRLTFIPALLISDIQIRVTADGSQTLYSQRFDQTYHSQHGAWQESVHIFINSGYRWLAAQNPNRDVVRIFEVGFGTGLNALLTCIEGFETKQAIEYHAIELFPITWQQASLLHYPQLASTYLQDDAKRWFRALHEAPFGTQQHITPLFSITKIHADLLHFNEFAPSFYHLVYFDAFSPEAQPQLWTQTIFERLFQSLVKGGALLTYSAKGTVKQALRDAAFDVKRLPGPAGKRHIVRAVKN